jgi:hypothetical protein
MNSKNPALISSGFFLAATPLDSRSRFSFLRAAPHAAALFTPPGISNAGEAPLPCAASLLALGVLLASVVGKSALKKTSGVEFNLARLAGIHRTYFALDNSESCE